VETIHIIQIALIVFIGVVITESIRITRERRRRRQFIETMETIRRVENGEESEGKDFRIF